MHEPSSFPEVVPQQYYYEQKISAHESQAPSSYDNSTASSNITHEPIAQRRWTRWPILLLIGILITVIAGVVGGLIGNKAVGKEECKIEAPLKQEPGIEAVACRYPSTSIHIRSGPAATTIPQVTPSVTSPFVIPTTGCDSANTAMNKFKTASMNLRVQYDILCNTAWVADDIFAIRAESPSDCIEACASFNKGSSNKTCAGGGFIPEWYNKTVAIAESREPYNCFLKGGMSNIRKNDRGVEVVGLCLNGKCDHMLE